MKKYIASATLKAVVHAENEDAAKAAIEGIANQFGNFPPTVSVSYAAEEDFGEPANTDTTEQNETKTADQAA